LTRPRFHVPGAGPGARVELPGPSAHHARNVLRLRRGDEVCVFDGAGRECLAELLEVSSRRVVLQLGGPVRPRAESPLFLVLAAAALRGDRMELVIQKATEMGVSEVRPTITHHTDKAARPALEGSRGERWSRVAASAAEQSGRAFVPHIAPPVLFDALLCLPFPGERVLLLEEPGLPGLASLQPSPTRLLLAVGPPGGFAPFEVDRARAAGFRCLGLGPRVLRAETASIAAVAVAQALFGDLTLATPSPVPP
jgi:16S rRNA (uracil1498-N3)-methyltransferase